MCKGVQIAMAWERFHHICRRSLTSLQPGESLEERVRAVEANPGTALYGEALGRGTLPRRVLDSITACPDQDRARTLLELYANLNLAKETTHPLQLKRIVLYLTYVSVLFVVINGIYQLKVAPNFIALFETFQIQTPYHVALFREYGSAFAVLVVLLLVLALVMGYVLKGLADYSSRRGRGGLTRFLVLPKVRAVYANLEAAILYPLGDGMSDGGSHVISHLQELEQQGVGIREEIEGLVRSQHRRLVELCEKQMRLVYAFCVGLIVVMIVLFLVSAYSPIFMMGEVV